ncbi:MAG TPA: hypothetical protein VNU21_17105 [Usitatibacter sp.]|jgi:hypothetical protein|nr:hypothetical protein [Usitatibacter sp.]
MKLTRLQEVRWITMALVTVVPFTLFMRTRVDFSDPVIAVFWICLMLVLVYCERRYVAGSDQNELVRTWEKFFRRRDQ